MLCSSLKVCAVLIGAVTLASAQSPATPPAPQTGVEKAKLTEPAIQNPAKVQILNEQVKRLDAKRDQEFTRMRTVREKRLSGLDALPPAERATKEAAIESWYKTQVARIEEDHSAKLKSLRQQLAGAPTPAKPADN